MSVHPTESLPSAEGPGPGVPSRDEVKTSWSSGGVSRRTALKALSASAVLAAGAGCTRKPKRHIVSLAEMPEYQRPGKALWYASTWTEGDWPYGIMVKAREGRPVKIEGLPDHPLNRGKTNAQMQASLYTLYDADRLQAPEVGGVATGWEKADAKVVEALKSAETVVLLTRANLGPAERALVKRFLAAKPGTRHLVHEPAHDGERRRVWKQVYGRDGIVRPDLTKARVILSLDCDFLGTDGETLSAIRDFAANRKVADDPTASRLSRLYVAEAAMTTTGSNADHRIPLRPRHLAGFVDALSKAVAGDGQALRALAERGGYDEALLKALAADLAAARGAAVVLAGGQLPAPLHAAVALLNEHLDSGGKTLTWLPEAPTLAANTWEEIYGALQDGVDVVLALGVNPVYDAFGFGALPEKVGTLVAHGSTRNETLEKAHVALGSAHNLESWNDAAPLPGVRTLCQPLIAPLFGGRQEAESLLLWGKALAPGDPAWKGAEDWHDFVRDVWARQGLAANDADWQEALRKGLVGQAADAPFPALDRGAARKLAGEPVQAGDDAYDLEVLPHCTILDGRFANNGWLQELPDVASKVVWDNAAALSPATAKRLGAEEGDWIAVEVGDKLTQLPVLVQPGTAPDTVVATLGHGRTAGAGLANGVGVNAVTLLAGPSASRFTPGVGVAKLGRARHRLARTQKYFSQEGRPIVLDGTKEEYVEDPAFVKHRTHVPPLRQMHGEFDYSQGHKWAMAIDLGACIGCGACTTACQAENNVLIVGKEECDMGREMSWIRIDRYEAGDPENPKVSQQPMLCQQCDNAPCENVCPVNATAHSPEGLNEQTYNRCVGTRYCANNCPYKVRRFNFYAYDRKNVDSTTRELMFNPQVTVRSRGVMEKCTFCVQRINAAKFAAANAGASVPDGGVDTACMQACPASAIVFGDVNTEGSRIAAQRSSDLAYHVLEEMNVRPNVSYLARVRNPNPAVAGDEHDGGHG